MAALAVVAVAVLLLGAPQAGALENGLARTPPMGWNGWNAFGCDVNADLVRQTADAMAANGMRAAGYEYVNIDDCWAALVRDANGDLQPDPAKFPDGIRAVADYVHARGLKLGIYASPGILTCARYPGSNGYEQRDARTFASWGVDYLKYDLCVSAGSACLGAEGLLGLSPPPMVCDDQGALTQLTVERYAAMRAALAATGRPIVYSMSTYGVMEVHEWGADVGNLWRTTTDIDDSYSSLVDIFHRNVRLHAYARPGAWNDPDMMQVGNGGMTTAEYRSHFSLWAVMAAPLISGTDLRTISPAHLEIYTNREVIAVDQDPLGKQGVPVSDADGHWVISKELADGGRAVVLFNETDAAARIGTTTAALGLPRRPSYRVRNLWTQQSTTSSDGRLAADVPAHSVVMYRVNASFQEPKARRGRPSTRASRMRRGRDTARAGRSHRIRAALPDRRHR